MALYRTGDWKGSIEELGKSMELGKSNDRFAWFFLAMAQWKLGQKDKARIRFDKAAEWTGAYMPNDLRELGAASLRSSP